MSATLGSINPLRYRGYVYDVDTELFYLQSRYYSPETGRFLNADAYTSTGQGLLGNNMFAYCVNNPVCFYDPSGDSASVLLLFCITGAIINVLTTFIGAVVTGQSYSALDGLVAAAAGAACVFDPILGGLISGIYTTIMSYQNGADLWAALLAGGFAGVLTTLGIGNLAALEKTLANLGVQAFVDLVFCTSYNSMSAAVYKAVTGDEPTKINPQNPERIAPHIPESPAPGSNGGGGGAISGPITNYCYPL